jgi:RNA polymerase sigma factor (sigma-70 family)
MAAITQEDSRALHAACQSPRESEQAAAYQQLGRLLYEIAWRRIGGDPRLEHLAADCMQESLLVIWRKLQAGQGPREPERFVGWSAAILINKLREALRRLEPKPAVRRAKRVALSQLSSLDAPLGRDDGPSLAQRLPADHEDPDSRQGHAELRALIAEIAEIDAISEQSRIVLLRGFIEGMDDDELAALLETSKANVHVIRCRDLAKLRLAGDYLDRLREHFA